MSSSLTKPSGPSGFDEHVCFDHIVYKLGTDLPRKFHYTEGKGLVYHSLIEKFGDAQFGYALGIFETILEDSRVAIDLGDECDVWAPWRTDFKRRGQDLVNPGTPRMGAMVLPAPVPPKTLLTQAGQQIGSMLSQKGTCAIQIRGYAAQLRAKEEASFEMREKQRMQTKSLEQPGLRSLLASTASLGSLTSTMLQKVGRSSQSHRDLRHRSSGATASRSPPGFAAWRDDSRIYPRRSKSAATLPSGAESGGRAHHSSRPKARKEARTPKKEPSYELLEPTKYDPNQPFTKGKKGKEVEVAPSMYSEDSDGNGQFGPEELHPLMDEDADRIWREAHTDSASAPWGQQKAYVGRDKVIHKSREYLEGRPRPSPLDIKKTEGNGPRPGRALLAVRSVADFVRTPGKRSPPKFQSSHTNLSHSHFFTTAEMAKHTDDLEGDRYLLPSKRSTHGSRSPLKKLFGDGGLLNFSKSSKNFTRTSHSSKSLSNVTTSQGYSGANYPLPPSKSHYTTTGSGVAQRDTYRQPRVASSSTGVPRPVRTMSPRDEYVPKKTEFPMRSYYGSGKEPASVQDDDQPPQNPSPARNDSYAAREVSPSRHNTRSRYRSPPRDLSSFRDLQSFRDKYGPSENVSRALDVDNRLGRASSSKTPFELGRALSPHKMGYRSASNLASFKDLPDAPLGASPTGDGFKPTGDMPSSKGLQDSIRGNSPSRDIHRAATKAPSSRDIVDSNYHLSPTEESAGEAALARALFESARNASPTRSHSKAAIRMPSSRDLLEYSDGESSSRIPRPPRQPSPTRGTPLSQRDNLPVQEAVASQSLGNVSPTKSALKTPRNRSPVKHVSEQVRDTSATGGSYKSQTLRDVSPVRAVSDAAKTVSPSRLTSGTTLHTSFPRAMSTYSGNVPLSRLASNSSGKVPPATNLASSSSRNSPISVRDLRSRFKEQTDLIDSSFTTGFRKLDAVNSITTEDKSKVPINVPALDQSLILTEVELMIQSATNEFLKAQVALSNLSSDSVSKTFDGWRKRGRSGVIEFRFDVVTQRDLVLENEQTVRFYGPTDYDLVKRVIVINNWKALVAVLKVRSFCHPDSVVKRAVVDSHRILEMLGAHPDLDLRLTELANRVNELIALARTEKAEAQKIEHGVEKEWVPPGGPKWVNDENEDLNDNDDPYLHRTLGHMI
ncbi:MAG: hypothetical protein M1814_001940 [Vezdaea aestivalis]|nr:MAG: hypothetical protein M1814_001940 [Vezdaea aestivalis]